MTATHLLLMRASRYPIEGCWVQRGWREEGVALVVLARRQPSNLILYGIYFVDYYCLGLKDTWVRGNVAPQSFAEEHLPRIYAGNEAIPIDTDLAHEIIYGAIEYAEGLGFQPQRDFRLTRYLLDPPDAHPQSGRIPYGRDGQPFYIAEEQDEPKEVIDQLTESAGKGHFGVELEPECWRPDFFGEGPAAMTMPPEEDGTGEGTT